MGTWAIVPVKRLSGAKSSLAPVLSPAARRELTLAMLEDVLGTLLSSPSIEGIIVTSPDLEVLEFAERMGARGLNDGGAELNISLRAAIEKAVELGASSVLILPGDVPLVRVSDIENIIAMASGDKEIVISPSKNNGTNALFIRHPGAMQLRFGGESFPLHLQEAVRAGATPKIYRSHNLENDLDDPEDIPLFIEMGNGTRCQGVLMRARPNPYLPRK